MKRPSWLIVFCIIPWALALAGLGWLVLKRFPPSGVVVLHAPFDGSSAWINPFLPGERVTSPGAQPDGWRGQRIFNDPVYTTARVPGVYDDLEISLDFRPVRQTLMELGLIHNLDAGEIDFRPMWFAPLQSDAWQATSDGYTRHAAGPGATAVWHASSTQTGLQDPASSSQITFVTLRGQHDIYAIPAGGSLSLTFAFQDVNRTAGADSVSIRVSHNDEDVSRQTISMGGSSDKGMGPVITKTIDVPQTQPGVYHIQLNADDDVFIRSITTNATHWVVGPRLVFGDEVGYGTSTKAGVAWTDSRHTVLETFHNEGLQSVSLGSDVAKITKTHEAFRLDRTDHGALPLPITAPVGDMRIIGDGWFSFSPSAWFAPQPRRITDATDPIAEGITQITTPYERPVDLGDGWYRATAHFHLDSTQDTIGLALSAPGIITRSGAIDIRNVTLIYRRPPLSFSEWIRVVKREVGNIIRRLR